MKVAIVHPTEGCDRLAPSAAAIVLHEFVQANQGRDQIKIFSGWTANPYLDLNTDMLPEDTPLFVKDEALLFAERITLAITNAPT